MIESRADWGSRPYDTSWLASTRGVKAHYTGGNVPPATLTDHARCRELLRAFEAQHRAQGWNGLGYSMWVCNHTAGMGRGPHALPAANGPGLNSGHYAILFLVGNSGVTDPTDAMKRNFYEARQYLIDRGNAGPEIRLHRDGYSTDCPGPSISTWVRAGAPLPPAGNPASAPPRPSTGGSVHYSSFGLDEKDAYSIPPGTWVDVKFREEYADPDGDHIAGLNPSILNGDPSIYSLSAGAELSGAIGGVEMRVVEVRYSAGPPPVDTVVEAGIPSVSAGELAHHAAVGSVQEGRKLRVQVRHHASSPVTLTRARVQLITQR